MKLNVDINGVRLKNPLLTAAGTFGYAREYKDLVEIDRLGGVILKGLSLYPSEGNPLPRVVETPCGLLNSVGLENIGIDAFIKEKFSFVQRLNTEVFLNIYGKTVDEYACLASIIDTLPEISGVEVNISCPNIQAGGMIYGKDPDAAYKVVEKVKKSTSKHVMVKLSPNVSDIVAVALSAEQAGADSISLINTITGMAIDLDTFTPMLANITGGLSGPAIKPVALRMVWEVAKNVTVPVIGVGGIRSAADAVEFIVAGATAVQVGTAILVNPCVLEDIINGMNTFLLERKIDHISDLKGCLKE